MRFHAHAEGGRVDAKKLSSRHNGPDGSGHDPAQREHLQQAGVEKLLRELNSDLDGLSGAEAARRLEQYGPTETIRIMIFMVLSIVVFRFFPITALLIILLALLNDPPIITIAYDNTSYSPCSTRAPAAGCLDRRRDGSVAEPDLAELAPTGHGTLSSPAHS